MVELREQVGDHAVVLFEPGDHRPQRGVARHELGEQLSVFAGVMPVQCQAESTAVDQELAGLRAATRRN